MAEKLETGIDRARDLAKRRAAWVAHAYAGLPYPTGPRRPIRDREAAWTKRNLGK